MPEPGEGAHRAGALTGRATCSRSAAATPGSSAPVPGSWPWANRCSFAARPADPYPDQEYVVRRCLKVVLKEEAEHHRYAVRDLAVLEAGA